ncbi:MAG: hypothetical protein ACOYNL_07150 [Rickettsiales bacterium]
MVKFIIMLCLIIGAYQWVQMHPESGFSRWVDNSIQRAELQFNESKQMAKREADKISDKIKKH